MRHPTSTLALAVCIAMTGSIADAAPARHRKVSKKAKHAEAAEAPARKSARTAHRGGRARHKSARSAQPREDHKRGRVFAARHAKDETFDDDDKTVDDDAIEIDDDTAEVAEATDDDTEEVADAVDEDTSEADEVDDDDAVEVDTHVKLHEVAAPRQKDWHVAIGPYLWASSVDANVTLGPASVASGVDFIDLQRHAKYGVEVLGEVRYRDFSLAGDLMYGVVGVNGSTEVGPLMVTLDGTASSLLVDGAAGYRFVGNDHSLFALEARGGVRYQRTAISGAVDVSGNMVAPQASVDAAADALAGARVFVQPWHRFYVSSSFDVGVFGNSTSTWSASADASLRITSHVLLSVGYRTLTTDRPHVSVVMHGPRAALQLLF